MYSPNHQPPAENQDPRFTFVKGISDKETPLVIRGAPLNLGNIRYNIQLDPVKSLI